MSADRHRDRLLDDALKHQLGAGRETAPSAGCLDAETLAAWVDGGLDATAVQMAEAHASNCGRCQALLATVARTMPAAPVAAPHGARLWRWWFAPLAATAAAVTVWMVVPPQPVVTPAVAPAVVTSPVAPEAAKSEPAPGAPLAENRQLARDRADAPPPRADAGGRKPNAQAFGALEKREEAEAKLADAAAQGRVAAAPPPAAAPRAQAAEAKEAEATARSSPSPDVIWTVGRAGLVQLATDGRTFTRVPFPEAVDLTAVTATDERNATVTTADGRTFRTADGGRTWTRP